jgi:secreted trypsin-like serine protease
LTFAQCQQSYAGSQFYETAMICASSNSATTPCQADQGGPLVVKQPDNRWYMIGISSWNIGCSARPFVYTKIVSYVSWITEVVTANSG